MPKKDDNPVNMQSLEERVRAVKFRLVMIRAASNSDADELAMEQDDLLAGICEMAREAIDILEPLRDAPAAIANWEWTPVRGGKR